MFHNLNRIKALPGRILRAEFKDGGKIHCGWTDPMICSFTAAWLPEGFQRNVPESQQMVSSGNGVCSR